MEGPCILDTETPLHFGCITALAHLNGPFGGRWRLSQLRRGNPRRRNYAELIGRVREVNAFYFNIQITSFRAQSGYTKQIETTAPQEYKAFNAAPL